MNKKLKQYLTAGKVWYDLNGTQIWIENKKEGSLHLADIRGWGHIQYMFSSQEKAGEFQDSIGEFIAEAIREKIERDYSIKP